MINYFVFNQIKTLHQDDKLTVSQIARRLHLTEKTVATWLKKDRFERAPRTPAASKLDPYKPRIRDLVGRHDYSAVQVYQFLKADGYTGKYTILSDYLRAVRPPRKPAFLSLSFAPGECAQVDFASCGLVQVGNTQRRLSVFVMVLCYSRMLYLEFTLKESLEHFLSCQCHAFAFFGGVPTKIMVDNAKVAILKHPQYSDVVPLPRYAEMARHYHFQIRACGIRKGNEKGRVESGIYYIQQNFLNGREIVAFPGLNDQAAVWRDTVANVRLHGTTRERPLDRLAKERPALQPVPIHPYDCSIIVPLRANHQFQVNYDANRYSVPANYAATQGLVGHVDPDFITIYHQGKLIARHHRSYDRHQTLINPDHERDLLAVRRHAHEQKLFAAFLALSPKAEAYYHGLVDKRLNPRHHLKKIMALAEIYDPPTITRALEDALEHHAFGSDYIANLLEQQQRQLPPASPLHLIRRQDLLELDMPPPDLAIYNPKPTPTTTKEISHEPPSH